MPISDEEIQDTNSSVVSDLDDQTAQTAQADRVVDDGAKSSTATGEEDKSLRDVVRDVVSKREPESATASPTEDEEAGSDSDPGAKKQDDDTYSDVPFNKHPRFQQLLRDRNAFKTDAARYQNVQSFLDQNGLTADEAGNMLVIGALAKTNPAEAWKQVKPWVEKILIAAGEVLPDDLKARVQTGELSHEAAMEISRSKAQTNSFLAEKTFREQQEERRQNQERVTSIENAASTWEQDRRLKDPNFDAKIEPLMKEVAFLQVKEGRPNTPDGVKDQLKRAYAAVNSTFAPRPAPTPVRKPVRPVVGGQVAGIQQPAVMSTLDIVRANRRAG